MVDRYRSWLEPRVARQMYELVQEALSWPDYALFKYFVKAMEFIASGALGTRIVDVGCGTGHYYIVLQRHFSGLDYSYEGIDFSEEMVRLAGQLTGKPHLFRVADGKTCDYSDYDIALASSFIEVLDDWREGAEALCRVGQGRFPEAIVLLHRVRVHDGETVRKEDQGYVGQPTYVWVHNEQELTGFFRQRGFTLAWAERWKEYPQATYVFARLPDATP